MLVTFFIIVVKGIIRMKLLLVPFNHYCKRYHTNKNIACPFFIVTKFENMGIQRNDNSFFTCYLKVILDRFFENSEFVLDYSISHY